MNMFHNNLRVEMGKTSVGGNCTQAITLLNRQNSSPSIPSVDNSGVSNDESILVLRLGNSQINVGIGFGGFILP